MCCFPVKRVSLHYHSTHMVLFYLLEGLTVLSRLGMLFFAVMNCDEMKYYILRRAVLFKNESQELPSDNILKPRRV